MKRVGGGEFALLAVSLACLAAAALVAGCGGSSNPKRSGKSSPTVEKALAEGKDQLTRGNRTKAIAAYSRAIKLDPECKEAYVWRGVAHNESGKPKDALADFTKAIELDPTDCYAYEQRASIYETSLHDSGKAKADRDKAFELRQQNRDDMRTRLKGKKGKKS